MGRDIMATRKAKAEVVNYLKVLEDLPSLAEDGKITEEVISQIHRLLTKRFLKILMTAVFIETGK